MCAMMGLSAGSKNKPADEKKGYSMPSSISTRSIANVTVSFGALANFEAKIYAAAREEGSGLNLVAIVDGKVVKPTQQYAVNGKVISWDNLERGIEVGDDSFIVISKSDIEATKAKTNKTVAITKFVPLFDPLFFDKSYVLTPNPDKKDKNPNAPSIVSYALLLKVMEVNGLVGQAKLEMRGKEHNVIVRASAGRLMLHTLFNASEIRTVEVKRPTFAITDELVAAGTTLVNTLLGTFEPKALVSESDEALNKLISRKIAESKGQAVPADSTTEAPVANESDALLAALTASLHAVGAKVVKNEKVTA